MKKKNNDLNKEINLLKSKEKKNSLIIEEIDEMEIFGEEKEENIIEMIDSLMIEGEKPNYEELLEIFKFNKENNQKKEENEKIKQLYEEIKKKDKKIEEFQKINSKFPFSLSNDEEIMSIIFNSYDQLIQYPIICKNTDKFDRLENILYERYQEYKNLNNIFICNGIKIKKTMNLKDNNISNGSIIIFKSQ